MTRAKTTKDKNAREFVCVVCVLCVMLIDCMIDDDSSCSFFFAPAPRRGDPYLQLPKTPILRLRRVETFRGGVSHALTSMTTVWQAMDLFSPSESTFSCVLALTLTAASSQPSILHRLALMAGLCGEIFGR